MLTYSLRTGTRWLELLSWPPEPTACSLSLKGPDLTSGHTRTCGILSKAPPARGLLLGGCHSHSHSRGSHCRAHRIWWVPGAVCQLPVSSCWAQPMSLSTVSVGAWVSSASLPCDLGAFPSEAWLWVQTSPSTALDAVYDPLNLYCLHRGSTGHTCSITQVPRRACQSFCLHIDSQAAQYPGPFFAVAVPAHTAQDQGARLRLHALDYYQTTNLLRGACCRPLLPKDFKCF